MAKYRKKPVEVEAFRFDGDFVSENGKIHGPSWAIVAYDNEKIFTQLDGEMYINTSEGYLHISAGDYIIRDVNGELYPCKPDIFDKTYEKVGE